MTNEEMKVKVTGYLNSKGFVMPADTEREMAVLAATYPNPTAEEEGISDNVIARAYKAMLIMTKSNGPTEIIPATSTVPAAVTSAEATKIGKAIASARKDRLAVTQSSSIAKLVIDKPAASEYIPADTQILFVGEAKQAALDKLAKDKDKVVADGDDFKSKSNYDELVNAITNDQPIAVNISDKCQFRAIGVDMVDANSGSKLLSTEKLKEFLSLETIGYIEPRAGKAGCRLKKITPSATAGATAQTKKERVVVAFIEKKEAIEAGAYVIASRKDESGATAKRTVRSLLTYKVTTDKLNPKTNTYKLATKAVSQSLVLPALKTDVKYVELEPKKGKSDWMTNTEVLKNIAQAQTMCIVDIANVAKETNGAVSEDVLSKLQKIKDAASKVVVDQSEF